MTYTNMKIVWSGLYYTISTGTWDMIRFELATLLLGKFLLLALCPSVRLEIIRKATTLSLTWLSYKNFLPFYPENNSVSTIRIFNVLCPKHLVTFLRRIRIVLTELFRSKTVGMFPGEFLPPFLAMGENIKNGRRYI
jgi:hypothetical protein